MAIKFYNNGDTQVSEIVEEAVDSNLIGHWDAGILSDSSTMTDLSGYGNDVIIVNDPIFEVVGDKNALTFDGIDDYASVTYTDKTILQPDFITISSWVYNNTGVLFMHGEPVNRHTSGYGIYGAGYAAMITATTIPVINLNDWIPLDVWYYLTVTWDGTNIKGYINGELKVDYIRGGGKLIYNVGRGTTTFLFHNYGYVDSVNGDGSMGELRIYDKALTESEINYVYDNTKYKFNNDESINCGELIETQDGLISHWGMGDNTTSSVVTDNYNGLYNGTYYNNTTEVNTDTKSVSGFTNEPNSALSFDGSLNYIQGDFSDDGDIYTLSVWVKVNTVDGINGVLGYTTPNGYRREMYLNDTQIRVFVPNAYKSSSLSLFNVDEWYNITCGYDGTNVFGYINGVSISFPGSTSYYTAQTPDRFKIGTILHDAINIAYTIDGTIDEARIYNKALSESEITDLYNNTKHKFYNNGDIKITGEIIEI